MTTGQLTKIIESQTVPEEERRNYIGASLIGSDCLRQIWYEYTGAPAEPISLKLKRTFEIGKRLEGMVIDLVRDAEIQISFHFEGDNLKFNDPFYQYFQGTADAIIAIDKGDFLHLSIVEIKTAKDASFKIFVESGLKKWNPRYYAQIQSYMGMSGIFSAYILVLNKDNSDIWDEFVNYDPVFYESLRQKAKLIHEAKIPPPRINGSPLWYQCKTCKFRKTCHG